MRGTPAAAAAVLSVCPRLRLCLCLGGVASTSMSSLASSNVMSAAVHELPPARECLEELFIAMAALPSDGVASSLPVLACGCALFLLPARFLLAGVTGAPAVAETLVAAAAAGGMLLPLDCLPRLAALLLPAAGALVRGGVGGGVSCSMSTPIGGTNARTDSAIPNAIDTGMPSVMADTL